MSDEGRVGGSVGGEGGAVPLLEAEGLKVWRSEGEVVISPLLRLCAFASLLFPFQLISNCPPPSSSVPLVPRYLLIQRSVFLRM